MSVKSCSLQISVFKQFSIVICVAILPTMVKSCQLFCNVTAKLYLGFKVDVEIELYR